MQRLHAPSGLFHCRNLEFYKHKEEDEWQIT